MSHYTVGVIIPKEFGENELNLKLQEALAPFDENLEVDSYIAYTKEELKEKYNLFLERVDQEEEPVTYEEYVNDYCGYGLDSEGNALSRYNKNSKWDWYVIGGRWNECMETKNGTKVNYAKIKDIAFNKEFTDKELVKAKEMYSTLITDGDFFKPEYYQRKYPTLESYLKSYNFSTYALLDKDGKWHEPGTMGWFGMSSAGPEEQTKFQSEYMQLINEADQDDWLIVVDCHI